LHKSRSRVMKTHPRLVGTEQEDSTSLGKHERSEA
jgi:hypothetical protein